MRRIYTPDGAACTLNGIGTGPPPLVGSGVNTIDGAAYTSTAGPSTCLGTGPHALVGSSFSIIDGAAFMPTGIGTNPHALEGSVVGCVIAKTRAPGSWNTPRPKPPPSLRSSAPCRASEGPFWPCHFRIR